MNICLACEGYPYPSYPQYFEFVEQLCNAMAINGENIFVIAPQSVTKLLMRRKPFIPFYRKVAIENSMYVEVFSPKILSIGNCPVIGNWVNFIFFRNGLCRTFKRINKNHRIDVCYGHFWHVALSFYPIAKKYNIPLFVASGECIITINKILSVNKLKKFSNKVSGVVCVSTKNKEESIEKCFVNSEKCGVFPNSIDSKVFYFKNKKDELREKLGIKKTDFIVAFVGAFINRKGPIRVAHAIQQLGDSNIKSFFIGINVVGDDEDPKCDGILFKGPLAHDKIPDYLNCADVFVLPTLAEGCCNAIIEALACGLPIISSNKSFNYDILDDTCSILIDPLNVEEIKKSIKYLKDNPNVRDEMSRAAIVKASTLNIEQRAKNILDFIESHL